MRKCSVYVNGIETAANGLCFFRDGQMAYITRRFDVHPGGKYITPFIRTTHFRTGQRSVQGRYAYY